MLARVVGILKKDGKWSRKRIIIAALAWVFLSFVCLAAIPTDETPSSSSQAGSQQAENKLVREFGCQWIMDTYRPMVMLGRDAAIQHLSNEMNLKKGVSITSYVGTGDAAAALRVCEGRGFR